MPVAFSRRSQFLFLFAASITALLAIEHVVVQSLVFVRQPRTVAFGITFDIVVGIPVLYWLLIVRPLRINPLTLIAALLFSITIASLLLPPGYQQFVRPAQYVLMLVEAVLLIIALRQFMKIIQAYRLLSSERSDFIANFEEAMTNVLGKMAVMSVLVTEISTLYYAFSWDKRIEAKPGQTIYTTYRRTGISAILIMLFVVTIIEAAAVHLVIARWSPATAWILSALSAYTALLIASYARSLPKRPVLVDSQHIHLRVGLFWRATTHRLNVETIRLVHWNSSLDAHTLNAAKPLMTEPNLLLVLKEPVEVVGLYGIRRKVSRLAIYIDEPEAFIAQMSS